MAMTPEQMQREERHASLTAVAHSLTEAERVLFLGKVARQYPRLQGAQVADVLDLTNDHDMFLDQTEPFFERFDAQMPDVPGVIFAAHVLIILGLQLTPGRVWSVLQRAGVVDVPRYPEVEVGLWAYGGGQDPVHDGNHLLVKARAEQGMREAGVPESEITEFRNSVRDVGPAGYRQNMADIARWVTLVDRYTEIPRKIYDPVPDLAMVLAHLHRLGVMGGGGTGVALDNLRSHLDMRAPETAEAGLRSFFGREA